MWLDGCTTLAFGGAADRRYTRTNSSWIGALGAPIPGGLMPSPRTRLIRLLAIAATTIGFTAGAGAGVAAADPTSSSSAGGTSAADHTARDEHRPAGAGTGRKIG